MHLERHEPLRRPSAVCACGLREPLPGRRQAVGAGAFSALQMSVTFRTRHQGKAGLHLHGLARTDLSAVQGVTGDRLRTRKPFIHAVVAVSAVSAVQMSTPRGQSLADALPASCWPDRLVLVSVTRQRRREGRGASKVWSLLTGNRSLPSFFACAGFEGVGYPPPSWVLPGRSQLRVVSSARTR